MSRRRRRATRHGWLVIDKPTGWTSHDVVARVRRIVGEQRVGHAGTLDPMATGVLPVAVGHATRTIEYLTEADKAYRAWIRFGAATDTADAEGAVIAEADVSDLALDAIVPHLDAFRGHIRQRPPAYSAVRIDGAHAYHRARQGESVEMPERSVTVSRLAIVGWEWPTLCVDIVCSKGTYIRSIARDLGEQIGVFAHLGGLVRTRSGPFVLEDALSPGELEEAIAADRWRDVLLPADRVLLQFTPVVLDERQSEDWQHGKPVTVEARADATETIRAYNAAGAWLGIGLLDRVQESVQPVKVLPTE